MQISSPATHTVATKCFPYRTRILKKAFSKFRRSLGNSLLFDWWSSDPANKTKAVTQYQAKFVGITYKIPIMPAKETGAANAAANQKISISASDDFLESHKIKIVYGVIFVNLPFNSPSFPIKFTKCLKKGRFCSFAGFKKSL